jgi:hypothetical protein
MSARPTALLPISLIAVAALAAAGCNRTTPARDAAAKDAAPVAQKVAAEPPQPVAPPAAIAEAEPAPPPPPARMTSVQEADFDAWIVRTYLGCWKQSAAPSDSDPYVAYVRLAFRPDGSLAKAPKLVNPPSDPALKPQAKSVMTAVQACNPLPVPAQYRPFYEQWKTKTIHFSPQVASR